MTVNGDNVTMTVSVAGAVSVANIQSICQVNRLLLPATIRPTSYLRIEIIHVHIYPAVRGGEAGVSDADERSIEVLIGGHTHLRKHASDLYSVLYSQVNMARATVVIRM